MGELVSLEEAREQRAIENASDELQNVFCNFHYLLEEIEGLPVKVAETILQILGSQIECSLGRAVMPIPKTAIKLISFPSN